MSDQPEPVRKDLLPPVPPPEWEFHTVLGAYPDPTRYGVVPGDNEGFKAGNRPVIRRRITYGDWEPVRPDYWAAQPPPCGASDLGAMRQPLGPCILRHQHDGPVHQDANGATWHRTGDTDPLAPFRALLDQATAAAVQAARAERDADDDTRPDHHTTAAVWTQAAHLLDQAIRQADNPRTTPNNPPASGDAEVCCACGGGPIVYRNFEDNPFCAHCSECDCGLPDGRCTVSTCPDCGVRPGAEHADGCDVARCPTTGKQRLSCDHGASCGGPLCRTRWIGRLPAPAAGQPNEDAAAHYILTTICQTNGYRPPPPGVRITADDLAEIDRAVEGGTPFGEAVSDVISLANWRARQADTILDQRLNDALNGPETP
ncbi:hypothetical protein DT019_03135 [Streptomyces sp. SDr-06]|uniref:hypothetical protein n=1 Tax=Streptomyces sp. SDr-06 TaxID=2267702 RepID=UPI000DEA233B|nr:hypothetical protein [Streptomyces sp. SDr-06]RCH70498.1 hypothetical protein DT019_03135 [Streptomyces sp. SDr-06]